MAIPVAQPAEAAAEHKAVKKQIKALKKVASTGQLDEAGAAELKALKKKAKALKAASTQQGDSGASDGGEATAEGPAPAAAEGTKKKRKPDAAQQQQEGGEPAAKKSKKGKKGGKAGGEPIPDTSVGGMAVVGDRQLAASRPALVKALYSEAAEVATMSDADVAAWREERRTAVEGAALRPITSFAQSGAHAGGGAAQLLRSLCCRRAVCYGLDRAGGPSTLGWHRTAVVYRFYGAKAALAAQQPPHERACYSSLRCVPPENLPKTKGSLQPSPRLTTYPPAWPPLQACQQRSCTPPATSRSPAPSRRSACPSR